MSIDLNQATFRRLVQFYILSLVLVTVVVILEMMIWSEFGQEFDRLNLEFFGEPSDLQLFLLGGIAIAGGVAHIIAAFGLLKFRPWSKTLIWASLIPTSGLAFVPGSQVTWSGPWSLWIEVLSMALFGAIMLLAYARGLGDIWFRNEARP